MHCFMIDRVKYSTMNAFFSESKKMFGQDVSALTHTHKYAWEHTYIHTFLHTCIHV